MGAYFFEILPPAEKNAISAFENIHQKLTIQNDDSILLEDLYKEIAKTIPLNTTSNEMLNLALAIAENHPKPATSCCGFWKFGEHPGIDSMLVLLWLRVLYYRGYGSNIIVIIYNLFYIDDS